MSTIEVLFVFALVWLNSAWVGYLLIRQGHRIRRWTWNHSDALFMGFICVMSAPLVLIIAVVFNVHSESLSKWYNKTSKW